jgi:transcriptional regulator with XRE-family HTH domain
MALANEAGVSTRHLSFVETGKSRPSPELILRLAEHLDVPLPRRNAMLLAGGYAPAYPNHEWNDPELASVRAAAKQILDGHGPNPAVLVDQHWQLVETNPAVALLTADADPHLLAPPINILRLALHPGGMAPRILNLPEWRAHLLDRLHRQVLTTGDPALQELHGELGDYPGDNGEPPVPDDASHILVPLRYRHEGQELSFISTTTVFGAPLDITISGLAVEAFFPSDEPTAAALRAFASA